MKGFLRNAAIFFAAASVAVLLLAGYVWFEVNVPRVAEVSVTPACASKGPIKVVQISDVHGAGITTHGRLITSIADFHPAVILITGDLIDRKTVDFKGVYEDMEELRKMAPVIFVTGNHELANPKGEAFIKGLDKSGVTVLRNASTAIGSDDSSFFIVGIEDTHFDGDDLPKALSGVEGPGCRILMSHTPEAALDIEEEDGIDLVLSGHTHGGQVRLPFIGALLLPDRKFDPRLVKGITKLDNGVIVYTDSGFGTSVMPVRFMNRSQMSFITIGE